MKWLVLLCASACAAGGGGEAHARKAAPAAVLQGVVSRVVDGDTLAFTPAGQTALALRLRDIEAPALCQPWGDDARRALIELALNKAATASLGGRDGQGRTVATVRVDGVDLSRRMVEDGHAWSVRTRFDRGPLVKEERMAHSLGRGLHGVAGAVRPGDFRRSHGPCAAPAPR